MKRTTLTLATVLATIELASVATAQTSPPTATPPSSTAPTTSAIPDPIGQSAAGQAASAAAPAPPPSEVPGGDIVVTASRTASGYNAPTPTLVVTSAALQQRGLTSVGDFLAEQPVFRGSSTSQTNTQTSTSFGANFADLRGLGSIRTLTLVDGRRHVPTSPTGQVDLNLVPTALIERVEVVTGGASAVWGSDAVSGVVNVILDKRLQGVKIDVSEGVTQYGDNGSSQVSAAAGTAFAGGRGHIVIGGDYVKSSGVTNYLDRAWGRNQPASVSPAAGRPADQPSRFYATGVQYNNQAIGGLITGVNADTNPANGADVLRGISFGPGGSIVPFTYGQTVGVSAINFTGGDPANGIYYAFGPVVPLERHVVEGHAEFDLADNVTVFGEATEGESGIFLPTSAASTTTITVRRDNPYIPAAITRIMDANGITSFGLSKSEYDIYTPSVNNRSQTLRFVGGLNGSFGSSWKWNGYYEWGRNRFRQTIYDMRINQNLAYAVDVTTDATGTPVCRNLVARAAGCQPINAFGTGQVSAAAKAYATGTVRNVITTREDAAALNLQGSPLSTWAGPVNIAVGGEYRREESRADADPIAAASGYFYGNLRPYAGSYSVKDVYGEIEVPLAKEARFAHALGLNAAVRHSSYSLAGDQTTWKIGGTYAPTEDIRFRAVRSRDSRAPNNSELYATTTSTGSLINPVTGLVTQTPILLAANTSLRPEKADTFTVGAVLTPRFAPRFQASIDFYDIKVNGAISSIAAQTIVDNCGAELRAGTRGYFCSFVTLTGTGASTVLAGVTQQLINLAQIRSRGIDWNATYRLPLGGGTLTSQVGGTYAIDLITDDGLNIPVQYDATGTYIVNRGSVINRAGQVGAFLAGFNNGATTTPHWLVNGSLTYAINKLTVTGQARYVGGGHLDNTLIGPDEKGYDPRSPISIGNNVVHGRAYLNLTAQYQFVDDGRRKAALYAVMNNVLDTDPPFPATGVSGLYDRLGRNFRVGARIGF